MPDREVGVLQGQFGQFGVTVVDRCGVQFAQFPGEDADRPAVRDDVMHRQHQDVVLVGDSDQAHPQQRILGEIERLEGLRVDRLAHLDLAGLRVLDTGQVD